MGDTGSWQNKSEEKAVSSLPGMEGTPSCGLPLPEAAWETGTKP